MQAPKPAPARTRPQAQPNSATDSAQTQRPAAGRPRQSSGFTPDGDVDPAQPPKPKPHPAPALAVACSGVFAKDSNHLKLAVKYDSRNVVFDDVDGPGGSKIKASVVFPREPKRRLEVLWDNDAGRSETQVIAINGQSAWTAPKGLKLGLPLAAVEKANGKPFKITGFGPEGHATVAGWEGGAMTHLPGGCKIGLRLTASSNASQSARRAVTTDSELMSNDPRLREIKPTITEILIGY
jgi:hypothetical protein